MREVFPGKEALFNLQNYILTPASFMDNLSNWMTGG